MEAYQRTVEEALQEQHSSMHGLSEAQAQERSSVFGLNKLQEEKKASLLKRLARQLSNPMIIVLLGAALISGITSAYAHPVCRHGKCDARLVSGGKSGGGDRSFKAHECACLQGRAKW